MKETVSEAVGETVRTEIVIGPVADLQQRAVLAEFCTKAERLGYHVERMEDNGWEIATVTRTEPKSPVYHERGLPTRHALHSEARR